MSTVVVLVLYAIAVGLGVWNVLFCEKQANKCLARAKRDLAADDLDNAQYWLERIDWWIRQGYFSLTITAVLLAWAIVFALEVL